MEYTLLYRLTLGERFGVGSGPAFTISHRAPSAPHSTPGRRSSCPEALHAIAERELRRGGSELTLGTTTLLHEAYLDIAQREGVDFASRCQFLAYAARAMRGLTIDYVRRRQAKKRGGEFHITSSGVESAPADQPDSPEALERLGAALDMLAGVNAPLAQLVDLHFFGGFTFAELAELRGVSERTIQRDWRKARLLLHRAMQGS